MKILFICDNFPPIVDGVGDYTYALALEFVRHKHKVSVICRKQQAIIVKEFKTINVLPIIENWNLESHHLIIRFLKETQPKWTILQYVPSSFHPKAVPFQLILLCKKIQRYTKLAIFFHEFRIRTTHKVTHILLGMIQLWIAKQLTQVASYTFTSIQLYKETLQNYTSNIAMIPIGSTVNVSSTTQLPNKKSKKSNLVISTFGIRSMKRFIKLVDELEQYNPNFQYQILGKQYGNIGLPKELPKNKVKVTGFLEREEVVKQLQNSDIFVIFDSVLPSGQGGSSLKSTSMAAALAAGLPVLGTKGDMNGDLLSSCESVFLIEPDDYAGFAEIILTLAEDKIKRRKLNEKSIVFFNKHLSWAAIYDKHISFMCED